MDYPLENDPRGQGGVRREDRGGGPPTIAPYWDAPDPCEEWPYPPTGTRGEITAAGSGPILVVGTTNDPATPYAWAESLAKQLEGGILITRVGEGGHTGYNKGNSCVDDAVDATSWTARFRRRRASAASSVQGAAPGGVRVVRSTPTDRVRSLIVRFTACAPPGVRRPSSVGRAFHS